MRDCMQEGGLDHLAFRATTGVHILDLCVCWRTWVDTAITQFYPLRSLEIVICILLCLYRWNLRKCVCSSQKLTVQCVWVQIFAMPVFLIIIINFNYLSFVLEMHQSCHACFFRPIPIHSNTLLSSWESNNTFSWSTCIPSYYNCVWLCRAVFHF